MIRADNPKRAVWLQHAAAFGKPCTAERVVFGKIPKLVPRVIDAGDFRVVGPEKIACKLQIVRRIGKDEIDACARKLFQLVDAITDENPSALGAALYATRRHTHNPTLQ